MSTTIQGSSVKYLYWISSISSKKLYIALSGTKISILNRALYYFIGLQNKALSRFGTLENKLADMYNTQSRINQEYYKHEHWDLLIHPQRTDLINMMIKRSNILIYQITKFTLDCVYFLGIANHFYQQKVTANGIYEVILTSRRCHLSNNKYQLF